MKLMLFRLTLLGMTLLALSGCGIFDSPTAPDCSAQSSASGGSVVGAGGGGGGKVGGGQGDGGGDARGQGQANSSAGCVTPRNK